MANNNIQISAPDPLFMKEVFDDQDQKGNLRIYALLIEKTFEAFGLMIQIVEIDIEVDHFLYCAKPKEEMEAKDIVKHSKDLALALASPTGSIRMSAPLQGKRDIIGIYIPRVNTIGQQALEVRNASLCKPIGTFRRMISNKLLKTSRYFFRWYESKLRPLTDRYSLLNTYLKRFRKMNNTQLIEAFNDKVGNYESTREEASYLGPMQREFDRRDLDYSVIANYTKGLSLKDKVKLVGKKIVIDEG